MTPKSNHPQQLQTQNVSTDDVESANGTNQGEDLWFADCSPWNRKDAATRLEVQKSYSKFIITSSWRAKRDEKKPPMAWIDNKNAYDMVPQSWIINCLKMYYISSEVIKFIKNTMENWRVELVAREKSLC